MTTFFDSPAKIWCWKLPRPLSFQQAVDFFSNTGEVIQGAAVPSWEYVVQKLEWHATKDVDDNRNSTIDAYAESIGIGESAL